MSSPTDAVVDRIFSRELPPLEPGKSVWAPELTKTIADLNEHRFTKAALHLANDDIDSCHLIAQASEGDPTADFLHATLHRREGDYWNSKYWYSALSRHPHPLCSSRREAEAFVDACEADPQNTSLREKQWEELKALVEWTRANCK